MVLRDSDEVAESPEFKKKFVRKLSKLASDMEFARQTTSLYKQRKYIDIAYSYFAVIVLIGSTTNLTHFVAIFSLNASAFKVQIERSAVIYATLLY